MILAINQKAAYADNAEDIKDSLTDAYMHDEQTYEVSGSTIYDKVEAEDTIASTYTGEAKPDEAKSDELKSGGATLVEAKLGDATPYAAGNLTHYSIRFGANPPAYASTDMTGSMDDMAMLYGSYATLLPCGYTLSGYEFAGWNTAPDGSGTGFADGESVINLATAGESITLYAQWTKDPEPTGAPTTGKPDGEGKGSPRTADGNQSIVYLLMLVLSVLGIGVSLIGIKATKRS